MLKNFQTFFDGEKYISSKQAAEIAHYTSDYIGQLCRGKKIKARRIGRDWFVSEESLLEYQDKLSGIVREVSVKIHPIKSSAEAEFNGVNRDTNPQVHTNATSDYDDFYDFDISTDQSVQQASQKKDFHLKELYKPESTFSFHKKQKRAQTLKFIALISAHTLLFITKINHVLANWIEERRYKKVKESESRQSRLCDTNPQVHTNAANLSKFLKVLAPIGVMTLIFGAVLYNPALLFDNPRQKLAQLGGQVEKIADFVEKIGKTSTLYMAEVPAKLFEGGFKGVNKVSKFIDYSLVKTHQSS